MHNNDEIEKLALELNKVKDTLLKVSHALHDIAIDILNLGHCRAEFILKGIEEFSV